MWVNLRPGERGFELVSLHCYEHCALALCPPHPQPFSPAKRSCSFSCRPGPVLAINQDRLRRFARTSPGLRLFSSAQREGPLKHLLSRVYHSPIWALAKHNGSAVSVRNRETVAHTVSIEFSGRVSRPSPRHCGFGSAVRTPDGI